MWIGVLWAGLRAAKGTNRAQTQIFTDSRLFLEIKHSGSADFRRKPQNFAGNRRKPQEPAENRSLAFVPLGSSLYGNGPVLTSSDVCNDLGEDGRSVWLAESMGIPSNMPYSRWYAACGSQDRHSND